LYYLILILSIVFLDQFSKIWIKSNLHLYESIPILGTFIKFTFVENPGIAFGISVGNFSKVILVISLIVIVFIIKEIINNKELYSSIGLAMIVGGAIGNLIDRILVQIPESNYRGVVDFIDIGTLTFRWYTFNIADSFVCIGMFWYLLLSKFELSK
tara:strand:+ start:205 stop:672 length:468 start_codon:yes stop_codon:yes gene_type:complete